MLVDCYFYMAESECSKNEVALEEMRQLISQLRQPNTKPFIPTRERERENVCSRERVLAARSSFKQDLCFLFSKFFCSPVSEAFYLKILINPSSHTTIIINEDGWIKIEERVFKLQTHLFHHRNSTKMESLSLVSHQTQTLHRFG